MFYFISPVQQAEHSLRHLRVPALTQLCRSLQAVKELALDRLSDGDDVVILQGDINALYGLEITPVGSNEHDPTLILGEAPFVAQAEFECNNLTALRFPDEQ